MCILNMQVLEHIQEVHTFKQIHNMDAGLYPERSAYESSTLGV